MCNFVVTRWVEESPDKILHTTNWTKVTSSLLFCKTEWSASREEFVQLVCIATTYVYQSSIYQSFMIRIGCEIGVASLTSNASFIVMVRATYVLTWIYKLARAYISLATRFSQVNVIYDSHSGVSCYMFHKKSLISHI